MASKKETSKKIKILTTAGSRNDAKNKEVLEKTVKKKTFAIASKKEIKEIEDDLTFELPGINITSLDRNYSLNEITKRHRYQTSGEILRVTTKLEDLGISTHSINTCDTILYGDSYKIKLFLTVGESRIEVNTSIKLRCACCHHPPPPGALILGIPIKYVASTIATETYFPETINLTGTLSVKTNSLMEKSESDCKLLYKTNYYEKVLSVSEEKICATNHTSNEKFIQGGYYDTVDPVCSFNCMFSRGDFLAKTDIRFRNYRVLAKKMYSDLFGKDLGFVNVAPSFLTLTDYGGFQSIEEYRKGFQFLIYRDQAQLFKAKGILNPVGRVIQQVTIE